MASKKQDEADTVPFQMRIEAETHSQLKAFAEETGMSMNQLVTGLLRGCMANIHAGEPARDKKDFIYAKRTPKCAFVGKRGEKWSEEEKAEYRDQVQEESEEDRGDVWFRLDYTNRGYIPGS